jgi:hypothetical protein
LSSAILYVAIVAIWAGVLIPRWLRRDSSATAAASAQTPETEEPGEESRREDDMAEAEAAERPGPSTRGPASRGPASRGPASCGPRRRPADADGSTRRRPEGARDRDSAGMLSARRRLLGLLVLLAIASGVLAERRLAAWWVVLPPIGMLLGYLALLREAAKADAERRHAGRSQAMHDPAARRGASPVVASAPAAGASAGGASAGGADAPEVTERRAQVIDISASWEQDDDQLYDQDADAKRRAVGD